MAYIVRNVDVLDLKPSTGVGIRGIIFEQVTEDTSAKIEDLISGGIAQFFPQVIIESLDIELSPNDGTINIYLKYTIINTNIEDVLQLNLNLQDASS